MPGDAPVSRETHGPDAPDLLESQVRRALLVRYPHGVDGLRAYADLLVGTGIQRGLIGPREADRLWSRHLANSAVVEELVPHGATVADLGSGAGLPGVPLALVRPDLRVVLVEPLLRRATFLAEAVASLGLGHRVEVLRVRAEDAVGPVADFVTARAVAPLDRLAGWALHLVPVGGGLLALKGSSATAEISSTRARIRALGGGDPVVHRCGSGVVEPVTTVVRVDRVGPAPGDPRVTGRGGRQR